MLELLNVMAPELSIAERRRALEALTGLSSDGSWDEGDSCIGGESAVPVGDGCSVGCAGAGLGGIGVGGGDHDG